MTISRVGKDIEKQKLSFTAGKGLNLYIWQFGNL